MHGNHAYSLLMHHVSGWVVVALSALLFADRLTSKRHRLIAIGTSSLWMSLGIFLFIQADPEGWPIGPTGFVESFTMPTAGEWLQHKLLSLIPILLGFCALKVQRVPDKLNYALAFAAVLGTAGLLSHQHVSHPGMDIVNLQHRLFALSGLLIAFSLVQEVWAGWRWKGKAVCYPIALLILGLQLVFYTE